MQYRYKSYLYWAGKLILETEDGAAATKLFQKKLLERFPEKNRKQKDELIVNAFFVKYLPRHTKMETKVISDV